VRRRRRFRLRQAKLLNHLGRLIVLPNRWRSHWRCPMRDNQRLLARWADNSLAPITFVGRQLSAAVGTVKNKLHRTTTRIHFGQILAGDRPCNQSNFSAPCPFASAPTAQGKWGWDRHMGFARRDSSNGGDCLKKQAVSKYVIPQLSRNIFSNFVLAFPPRPPTLRALDVGWFRRFLAANKKGGEMTGRSRRLLCCRRSAVGAPE
jgi:hypothetical protein